MESLSREESLRLLEDAPVAHIGLISEGRPYVTPMSFVVVGERILFRTTGGKKLRALRSAPSVCIEVCRYDDQSGDWASVIVTGTATEIDDSQLGQLTVTKLYEKYSRALGNPLSRGGLQPLRGLSHVIEVEIDDISGMSSGSPFALRTRPGRL